MRSSSRRVFLLLGLLASFCASTAWGAACCVSATSDGIGRLKVWENYAVGGMTSGVLGLGYWDADKEWHPYTEAYSEQEWHWDLWGIARLTERLEASLVVPFQLNHRQTTNLEGVGGGIADLFAGFRLALISIGEYQELPGISLTAGLLMPTGRSMDRSEKILGVDTTGRGAFVPSIGVDVEKTFYPGFVQLKVSGAFPIVFKRNDTGEWQRYGSSVRASVVSGVELIPGRLVLSGSVGYFWEAPLRIDHQVVNESENSNLDIGVTATIILNPGWSINLFGNTDIFVDKFGDNRPGRVIAGLGVRYGHTPD